VRTPHGLGIAIGGAVVVLGLTLVLTLGVTLVGCRSTGKELPGSTYCDTTAGSSLVPQSQIPSGSCKGSSTCIAFTAGEPCANPAMDAGECEWTCTCVDDTWTCTSTCSSMCAEVPDGFVADFSDVDGS